MRVNKRNQIIFTLLASLFLGASAFSAEEPMAAEIEVRQEYFCPQVKPGDPQICGYFPVTTRNCRSGYWLAEDGKCYRKETHRQQRNGRANMAVEGAMEVLVHLTASRAPLHAGISQVTRRAKESVYGRTLASIQENAPNVEEGLSF